jgi:hypothetical protein
MKLSNIIIILLLIIIIIFLTWKINNNTNKENMGNLTESIQNIISLHTDKNVFLSSATIDNIRTEEINISKNLNVNKGNFNNVKVNNNVDISNNLTANTGNITNLNITNLTGNNGFLRNVRSTDISANLILAESGRFRNVTSDTLNIPRYSITNLTANKICFDPTDATKCLTLDMIKSVNDIEKYNIDNIKNQYMYYPNTNTNAYNRTIPNTYNNNIVWTDLSGNIDLTGTSINNDLGKLQLIGPNQSWRYSTDEFITGTPPAYPNLPDSNNAKVFRTFSSLQAEPKGQGIEITIPKPPLNNPTGDYSVLWILVTNSHDRQYYLKLYQYNPTTDTIIKTFGKIVDGLNGLNKISPDGSTHNKIWDKQQWIPIPFDLSGNTNRKLVLSTFTTDTVEKLIRSIAFSTNPWNHCKVSGLAIHYQVNNDDNSQGFTVSAANSGLTWHTNYMNQPLVKFSNTFQFRIPFVNSGKDKIFYLVEHNSDWGPSIAGLSIFTYNTTTQAEVENQLGNFYTSFDNPFARHHNSKLSQRYYGVVIPKQFLPVKGSSSDNFIKLKVTIPSGRDFQFTEAGTHDKNSFD